MKHDPQVWKKFNSPTVFTPFNKMTLLYSFLRGAPKATNWREWLKLQPYEREKLAVDAGKLDLPVLPTDTSLEIHSRLVAM